MVTTSAPDALRADNAGSHPDPEHQGATDIAAGPPCLLGPPGANQRLGRRRVRKEPITIRLDPTVLVTPLPGVTPLQTLSTVPPGGNISGLRAPSVEARGAAPRLRRLPEILIPDDAGLTFAFKEVRQEHSAPCDCRSDTEGGRQDKSDGMKIDRNRLIRPSRVT